MKLKEHAIVTQLEFKMHGIQDIPKMTHAPAIVREFTDVQLELWRSKLQKDFDFTKNVKPNQWYVHLKDSKISQGDLRYWHNNKKRIYAKKKPVHNHYYIPIIYSLLGIATTLLMIFPDLREWLISLPEWISSFITARKH